MVLSDRKIDRRTDRYQTTLIDKDGMRGRILSLGWTSIDNHRQVMPMERFEPSTLAGPVFETGAYTVPPHRLITIGASYNIASIIRKSIALALQVDVWTNSEYQNLSRSSVKSEELWNRVWNIMDWHSRSIW